MSRLSTAGVFELRTFGGCLLARNGGPVESLSGQRKGLALLALLAGTGGPGVSRDQLLGYLWPESDEQRARTSLNQLVHSIRRQLDAPDLFVGSSVVQLNRDRVTSDVAQFRDAVRERDHATAVSLHRGPFLDGFYLRGADEFERWVANVRGDLARMAARSLQALAEDATRRGDARAAADWWRRLTEAEPLSAHAAGEFMRALDALGDRAAALEHARRYETLVKQELGTGLDPSLHDLVRQLRSATHATERTGPASHATPGRPVNASVAVLPFVNTSGDPTDEPFSDGLTDELIVALGRVPGLRVIGRTSVFALRGRELSVRAIGGMLDVTTVLEGTVRRAGERFRITAQLVSASHDSVLWSQSFERDTGDIFAVQEEIARAIVEVLPVKVGAEITRLTRGAVDVASYDLFLKGQYLLRTRISSESLALAVTCLEEVVERAPAYAPAYAALSHAHAYRAVLAHAAPREAFRAAKTAARQALALDDSLADAHVALGHVLFVHDYDWVAAEREFRRAIELEPANGTARFIFAICLQDQERFDEALAGLEIARAADPLAPFVSAVMGRVFVNARRPDDAIRTLRGALELVPDLDVLHQQLGHAYLQKGMNDEAVAALERAAALSGQRDTAQLAYVLAVTGRREEAKRIVAELAQGAHPGRQAFHLAMAYAGLGDADQAFRWLEHGYAERGSFMDGVKVTPAFDALHSDGRWNDLLRRMRLVV